MRRYLCNDFYFSTFSHGGAYIAGFIMADGCIKNNRISISLQKNDESILRFIKNELNIEAEIKYRTRTRLNTLCYQCVLEFSSKQIVTDLANIYGIHPKKTGTEQLPNIPKEYLYTFICGYFDGDGCVSLGTKKQCPLCVDICSASDKILKQINDLFGNTGLVYRSSKGTSYHLRMSTHPSIEFGNKIYQDTPFYLERKKQKFDVLDTSKLLKKIWTPEEDAKIAEYLNSSFTFKEMAKLMNIHPQAINKRAIKLGVYLPRLGRKV